MLGLARVIDWQDGYFYLESYNSNASRPEPLNPSSAAKALVHAEVLAAKQEPFDATGHTDQRAKTIAEVVRRRGQARFRKSLLEAYKNQCAITGCDAIEALEAAHITPYLGKETNHVQNGLLLRADIHNLFDLGLLAISPDTLSVRVSSALEKTSYGVLDGQKITVPIDESHSPSRGALAQHCEWSGLVD